MKEEVDNNNSNYQQQFQTQVPVFVWETFLVSSHALKNLEYTISSEAEFTKTVEWTIMEFFVVCIHKKMIMILEMINGV